MSSLILSMARRASTGGKIVTTKVKTIDYPIIGYAVNNWSRHVATALRTAKDKDLEDKEEQSDTDSNDPPTPSTIKDNATKATTAKTNTGKSRPALSTIFHDVDDLLFKNKNPFLTPFLVSTPFMTSITPTSRLHNDYMNMVSDFWRQMDSIDDIRRKHYLENFFSNSTGSGDKSDTNDNYFFFPTYDIHSDDDKVQIILDLPGVKMKDIDVSIVDDQWLQISGHRKKKSSTTKGIGVDCSSSDTGAAPTTMTSEYKFEKRFNFGDSTIDPTKIIASLADGVLRVSLPKLSPPEKSPTVPENVKKIDIVDGSEELEC